jgi:hypothetical protein
MRPANQTPVDRHHPPRGYGRDDPTTARWNNFRTAVRELLADQPSTRSVRNCARRMDAYVLAAAEHETTTRQQAEKARDAA